MFTKFKILVDKVFLQPFFECLQKFVHTYVKTLPWSGTEGAWVSSAEGPLIEMNQRGEISSFKLDESLSPVILLGIFVEYLHSNGILSSDDSLFLHSSEDLLSWLLTVESILDGAKVPDMVQNPVDRTESRVWCPVTTHFPNLNMHLLCEVFTKTTFSILCASCMLVEMQDFTHSW